MKRTKFAGMLRDYVQEHISLTKEDRTWISNLYEAFRNALNDNCIQIGSFARHTAIRPLHDLDILFYAGKVLNGNLSNNPQDVLRETKRIIEEEFKNPTGYNTRVSLQSHSITIAFIDSSGKEHFAVDLVPAYESGRLNEFREDVYWVPEIINFKHAKRAEIYEIYQRQQRGLEWILSDPRGYKSEGQLLHQQNADFRCAVKFLKAWKNECKKKSELFKLKSFHIEQALFRYFSENLKDDICDGIFNFLLSVPQLVKRPQFPDRADSSRYIDQYIEELTQQEKNTICGFAEQTLITLERFRDHQSPGDIIDFDRSNIRVKDEEFLFDQNIMTFVDTDLSFAIDGEVLRKNEGSFRAYFLKSKNHQVYTKRKIKFSVKSNNTNAELIKWKVKNDDHCSEPRGEITDHQTKNSVESTHFIGSHYVEAYAILNNECIARSKCQVSIL